MACLPHLRPLVLILCKEFSPGFQTNWPCLLTFRTMLLQLRKKTSTTHTNLTTQTTEKAKHSRQFEKMTFRKKDLPRRRNSAMR